MIIRFKSELSNKSAERWVLWKELELVITGVCLKHGVREFDIVYDEEKMVKNCTLSFDSEKLLREVWKEAGALAGENNLEIKLISQETLDDPCWSLIDQHKHKYNKGGYETKIIS